MNSDSLDQARYCAHVQAGREYEAANPGYNPWHPTPDQTTSHDAYVQTRVAEILDSPGQP
jgi:hypothetical protein